MIGTGRVYIHGVCTTNIFTYSRAEPVRIPGIYVHSACTNGYVNILWYIELHKLLVHRYTVDVPISTGSNSVV